MIDCNIIKFSKRATRWISILSRNKIIMYDLIFITRNFKSVNSWERNIPIFEKTWKTALNHCYIVEYRHVIQNILGSIGSMKIPVRNRFVILNIKWHFLTTDIVIPVSWLNWKKSVILLIKKNQNRKYSLIFMYL